MALILVLPCMRHIQKHVKLKYKAGQCGYKMLKKKSGEYDGMLLSKDGNI